MSGPPASTLARLAAPRVVPGVVIVMVLALASARARAGDGGEAEARAAAPAEPGAPNDRIATAIVTAFAAALAGDSKRAHRELSQARLMAPDLDGLGPLVGLAALVSGDVARARELLAPHPELALYLAMAQARGAGGITRAKDTLARHARLSDVGSDPAAQGMGPGRVTADPGALFLASLAFAASGEEARAHVLLERALSLAPSALDEAFAPDPAVGLARRSVVVIEGLGGDVEGRVLALAKALLEGGRRHAAVALAGRYSSARARRVVASALAASEPRRARSELELVLRDPALAAEEAEEARLDRIDVLLTLGDLQAARAEERVLSSTRPELRARRALLSARLALEGGGAAPEALELAESAASLDPRSNQALALLCRAHLANGQVERADAFANELLRRKPKDVDAFALLEQIAREKKDSGKARAQGLRSAAFREERQRLEQEVARREVVLRAVRDAEAGLGIAGLAALRGESPMLGLPIDLATARAGSPGFKRVSRDRILASCKDDLASLLRAPRGFDLLEQEVAPHGEVTVAEHALSAADPGRCIRGRVRRRAPGQ